MKITGTFGSAATYTLTRAILLYEHGHAVAATIHPVTAGAIQPGHAVTREGLEQLVASLGQQVTTEFLPERVLSLSARHLVWYCPAVRRRIWFRPASEENQRALTDLNGQPVNHPALLFIAGARQLRVFALHRGRYDRRPSGKDFAYVAPYFNLDERGHMCIGSARLPATLRPSAIEQYENGFFESAFSHSHGGHRLTRFPGGHNALWRAATDKKFVDHHLVRTKSTINQLIASLAKDKDDE